MGKALLTIDDVVALADGRARPVLDGDSAWRDRIEQAATSRRRLA